MDVKERVDDTFGFSMNQNLRYSSKSAVAHMLLHMSISLSESLLTVQLPNLLDVFPQMSRVIKDSIPTFALV